MKKLTCRQKEVLFFIKTFLKKTGYQPTISEIAKEIGVSRAAAFQRLKLCEKKGVIQLSNNRSRAIKFLEEIK